MLYQFLGRHRTELVGRCRAKVAARAAPRPTPAEMEHGIPLFLDQLIETLRREHEPQFRDLAQRLHLVGRDMPAELSTGAASHGHELLRHGFTVEQLVHDYGDLCQAVTELAMELDAPIAAEEFHTLNRCLDQAIADAVTEYALRRDQLVAQASERAAAERLGMLAHEMRNSLGTAVLAFSAIRLGGVAIGGATAAVVERSHARLRDLIDRTLADVRVEVGLPSSVERLELAPFIAEMQAVAAIEAHAKSCELVVDPVDATLAVYADRHMLLSALSNLLQNAFKFTHPHSRVRLRALRHGERVLIEVEDECGGLRDADTETLFRPFVQDGADRTGLGLGLAISRRAVEACGGTLSARNLPRVGCVFTIDFALAGSEAAAGPAEPAATGT